MSDSPIHFEGTIPNLSGTPRNEVGGIAVFGGVLMLSRTGFAIAVRRRDGRISLRQVPFARFWKRPRRRFLRLPLLRGAMTHLDMTEIGTRGLRYSAMLDGKKKSTDSPLKRSRMALLLMSSLLALLALVVVLPNLLTEILGSGLHAVGLVGVEGLRWFDESESPLFFNVVAGVMRVSLLVGYVAALAFDPEIRRVFEYHGAEHKAVLALEENRDVTVARARAHDTLHPRCGTTYLALACIVAIVVFAATDALIPLLSSGHFAKPYIERKLLQIAIQAIMLPVVLGATFEIMKTCARRPRSVLSRAILAPGFWLQRLTTRQPSDEQLEVAIVALFGALAISPGERQIKRYVVRGLEDDPSAPAFVPRSPARTKASSTASRAQRMEAQ